MANDRDPATVGNILSLIRIIHAHQPSLRVGQIMQNAFPAGTDLYYVENDVLYKGLQQYYYRYCSQTE